MNGTPGTRFAIRGFRFCVSGTRFAAGIRLGTQFAALVIRFVWHAICGARVAILVLRPRPRAAGWEEKEEEDERLEKYDGAGLGHVPAIYR